MKARPVDPRTPAIVDESRLQAIGGSTSQAFNLKMIRQVGLTVWCQNIEADSNEQALLTISAAMQAFKPTDEIEGMLAAQATAMHFGAMECFRRAIIPDQPSEVASKLRKDGANLARGLANMLAALDKKRGNGVQVVRVERVVVHEGGQAIVGNMSAPRMGGGA